MHDILQYTVPEGDFYADKNLKDGFLTDEGALPLIRFHSLENYPWLEAGFTTRLGGVSSGCFTSLNLRLSSEDTKENLQENYSRAAAAFGSDLDHLILAEQVHSTRVIKADISMALKHDLSARREKADGLFTDEAGLLLSGTYADCVPVFIADTKNRKVAIIHSGWRGSAGRIGALAARILCSFPDTSPLDLIAVIGPSICADDYEVTGEVIEEFEKVFPPEQMGIIARRTDEIHWQLDLWATCYFCLEAFGIPGSRIYFSNICTFENPGLLFSHRYTQGQRGNMNAFIMIRPDSGNN